MALDREAQVLQGLSVLSLSEKSSFQLVLSTRAGGDVLHFPLQLHCLLRKALHSEVTLETE